jgi:hypothetical protein
MKEHKFEKTGWFIVDGSIAHGEAKAGSVLETEGKVLFFEKEDDYKLALRDNGVKQRVRR